MDEPTKREIEEAEAEGIRIRAEEEEERQEAEEDARQKALIQKGNDEVQAEVDEINSGKNARFCPIIKDICRRDCTCWNDYRIEVDKVNGTFSRKGGGCDNPMLTGVRYE